MNLRLALVVLVIASITFGCAKVNVTTSKDEKGWHCNFTSATAIKETVYPIKKGMIVKMVAKIVKGEMTVNLMINGKSVFLEKINKTKNINYTIPKTGICILRLYIKNATGSFDFLI